MSGITEWLVELWYFFSPGPKNWEEQAAWAQKIIQKQSALELRKVHPESGSLAPRVAANQITVPGYTVYAYKWEKSTELVTEQLLLDGADVIGGQNVEQVGVGFALGSGSVVTYGSSRPDIIAVSLTGRGGKLMRSLTAPLTKGLDRIAIMIDGEVVIAPVVQATLDRKFFIDGARADQPSLTPF